MERYIVRRGKKEKWAPLDIPKESNRNEGCYLLIKGKTKTRSVWINGDRNTLKDESPKRERGVGKTFAMGGGGNRRTLCPGKSDGPEKEKTSKNTKLQNGKAQG